MTSVGEAVTAASARIGRVDALVLAAHALGVSRAWLAAHDRDAIAPEAGTRLAALVARREQGEPVAYLTGRREFFGRSFQVAPSVLIPRPETELLVEAALERLPAKGRLLDLGTGSGAIAVTVACERPDATVVATDLSEAALRIAQGNAADLGAQVAFHAGRWFEPLAGERFDVIAANPPYVAAGDPHLGQGDLRFEPTAALTDGSPDGLASLAEIAMGAAAHLVPGGWLLVEHGHDQAEACARLLARAGFEGRGCLPDLAGIPRVSGGRLPGAR